MSQLNLTLEFCPVNCESVPLVILSYLACGNWLWSPRKLVHVLRKILSMTVFSVDTDRSEGYELVLTVWTN